MHSARYLSLLVGMLCCAEHVQAQQDAPDPESPVQKPATAQAPASEAPPAGAPPATAPPTTTEASDSTQPTPPAAPPPPDPTEPATVSAEGTSQSAPVSARPATTPEAPPALTLSTDASELEVTRPYPRFEPSMRLIMGYQHDTTRTQTFTGAIAEQQRSAFFLGQARIQLQGELTKRIELELSAELSDGYEDISSSKPQYLRDAFMNLRLKRYFQVTAGHFKRPMSALEHRSAGDLQVRGRGLTNDLIIDDNDWGSRALGMQLWGKLKPLKLEWAVGAFNPVWAATESSRPRGADVLGRLTVEPIDDVTIGVNGGVKIMRQPVALEYDEFYAGGGDIELELGGFSFLADFLYAELLAPPAGVDSQVAMGIAGLASYDIPLSEALTLQPVVFTEYLDSSVEHNSSETLRFVGGLNWLIHETLRIMPQVEVVRWLGDPSEFSGDENLTAYLMFSLAM